MPRFLISAAHKSSGKTVVSTGLAAALKSQGHSVQCFKKGPDYIDPMWLSAASGRACYNLDFNAMSPNELKRLFAQKSTGHLSVIEANKGLFDGVALDGSDSNAELAKMLKTPVVLVIDTSGITRGIAPLLLGYQSFDSKVTISGVILNKVGGSRHEAKLRAAVDAHTDIPVLGSVWRNDGLDIGERHLGLTTPSETGALKEMIDRFGRIVGESVDLDRIVSIANSATKLEKQIPGAITRPAQDLRIGIAKDTAFGFYYADDLEAFAENGAKLVPIDMLNDKILPELDGLFIGGGFPETQAAGLAANSEMRQQVKNATEAGLPTYAECGGLMFLCQNLKWGEETHPMAGVISGDAIMCNRPQGRGYTQFQNTQNHPWESTGPSTSAHEFHYARIDNLHEGTVFARKIKRGHGTDGQNDGIVLYNLVAGFCHLRNSKANPWVRKFVNFIRRNKGVSP